MPYLSRNRIERIAERVVSAYKRLPVMSGVMEDRVDPEVVVKDLLNLSVEYHALSPNGSILGETSCGEIGVPIFDDPGRTDHYFLDGKTILIERELISEGANEGRYHFTLMHEAAHQMLGMIFPDEIGKNAPRHRIHYCTDGGSPGESYWDEWRANTLASAILMPAEMVRSNMKKFGLGDEVRRLNRVFSPKEYDGFCKMSEYMGVSHQALSIRLSHLGLLRKNDLDDPYRLVTINPGKEWDQMEREMDEI